jgi:carbamoyl-phosphate synthase small subunit
VSDNLPYGVEVTRTSLFDGSVEGIAAPELRAWSVQYHPEASPGPRDARYLFREFADAIGRAG